MATLSRRLIAGAPAFVRLFSAKPGAAAAARRRKDSLFRRLSDLDGASGKVASTIDEYVSAGRRLSITELEKCIHDLRKFNRFHLALEIMEWMELQKFNFTLRHYAVRLDLIAEVKGIAAAENYLYGLSPSTLTFNRLMFLYIKSGQPEKVLLSPIDMKKRGIKPNIVTYNILMNTYADLNDIRGAESVFEEMKRENVKLCTRISYITMAKIYIKAGYQEKSKFLLQYMEKEMNPHDLKAYHDLITLYASLSDLDQVYRVWKSLKSNISVKEKNSYLIMVQALGSLGELEGMTQCYKEWESVSSSYDTEFDNAVIHAYLKHGMVEEAESVLEIATSRSTRPPFYALEQFMIFYLNSKQIKRALQIMETATSKAQERKWEPRSDTVDKFLNYFKQESDVDGAEEFYMMMKWINCIDIRLYEALLETYEAAGQTALGMRSRIEEDGVEISSEIERVPAVNFPLEFPRCDEFSLRILKRERRRSCPKRMSVCTEIVPAEGELVNAIDEYTELGIHRNV